jgi:hypothetical protein
MKTLPFLNIVLIGGGLFILGASSAARATLGQPASSISEDAYQMNATAGVNPNHLTPRLSAQIAPNSGSFTVEQITTPDGAVVSEYIDQGGTVFAVSWRGPKPPNVAALLGTYFKQYSEAANSGAPSPFGIHTASAHASDVTVESAGHMGFMWGRAYLPARMPAGVNPSEIK